ncbi:MAG TPA: hypothetical protein VGG48_14195 [Rhizomicrobium sp.]|jgi:hypothetical protein
MRSYLVRIMERDLTGYKAIEDDDLERGFYVSILVELGKMKSITPKRAREPEVKELRAQDLTDRLIAHFAQSGWLVVHKPNYGNHFNPYPSKKTTGDETA